MNTKSRFHAADPQRDNPLLAAALDYAARGWRVLPLYSVDDAGRCDCGAKPGECKAGKHPRTSHGLKDASTDAAMIRAWWLRWPQANIGIATGAGSGLVVVDVDGSEGRASLAELEATYGKLGGTVTARAARGPHIYCGHPGVEVRSRVALAGHPGLDVRADGGYVVAPPSRHASGVTYAWVSAPDGELAPLPSGWLALLREGEGGNGNGTGHRAPAAAPGSPIPEGRRNATLARLAGAMRRQGAEAPAIEVALLAENAARCAPPLPESEVRSIAASITRYEAGAETDRSAKPAISISFDVRATVDAAREALIRADLGIYQRAGALVRVIGETGRPQGAITRPAGAPMIAELRDAALLEALADAADWTSRTAWPAHPPKHIRDALRERHIWPGLPWLEGVITAPTLRPDGSILDCPGYDPATGLLYDPQGVPFPPIKDRPTRGDAAAALVALAEPFDEFPFTDYATGVAVTVAAVLTLIGRPGFDGPAPMFPVRSTTPGSGKDLLACAVGIIATGRQPVRTTAPRGRDGDNEWRKRILAHALAGDPAILIGNVEGTLQAPTLADTLTKTTITDRLLGANENVTLPIRAVWFASGNGLSFGGDLSRRVVPVELDPGVEHPEDREGPEPGRTWAHPDLLAYVRAERPRLVTAALTALRAYALAGRPPHGKPLKGSFEAWDRLIRGAVIWALDADPLAACEAIRDEADSDLEALRAAAACWRSTFRRPAPDRCGGCLEGERPGAPRERPRPRARDRPRDARRLRRGADRRERPRLRPAARQGADGRRAPVHSGGGGS